MELWSFLFKCRKFGKLEINTLLSAAFLYLFEYRIMPPIYSYFP